MKVLIRVISVLQIVGGLYGLIASCSGALANASRGAIAISVIIVAAVNLISLAAGVELWRGRPFGRWASIGVQALQLPKIISPAITFMISFGLDFWVYYYLQGARLTLGFEYRLLGFNQFFVNTQGAPTGFGISLVSCIFLAALLRYRPGAAPKDAMPLPPPDQPGH